MPFGVVLGRLFAIAECVVVLFAPEVIGAEQQGPLILHLALDGIHDVVGRLLLTASTVVLDDELRNRRGVAGSRVDERNVEGIAARGARHGARQEEIGVEAPRELAPLDDTEVVLVELQAPELVTDRLLLDGGQRGGIPEPVTHSLGHFPTEIALDAVLFGDRNHEHPGAAALLGLRRRRRRQQHRSQQGPGRKQSATNGFQLHHQVPHRVSFQVRALGSLYFHAYDTIPRARVPFHPVASRALLRTARNGRSRIRTCDLLLVRHRDR